MPTTARIVIVADHLGRVVAAELPTRAEGVPKEETPAGRLVPLDGQRAMEVDVPREVLELPGPHLRRYFSSVQIRIDGTIQLPKIVVKKTRKK